MVSNQYRLPGLHERYQYLRRSGLAYLVDYDNVESLEAVLVKIAHVICARDPDHVASVDVYALEIIVVIILKSFGFRYDWRRLRWSVLFLI